MGKMHRLMEGCLLAALLLGSSGVLAQDDRYSDRERERERGDRRYEDQGYDSGRYESNGRRECDEGRDDAYRGRDCDDYWGYDHNYGREGYVDGRHRRHDGTTDGYGKPDYIGQPTHPDSRRYTDRYGSPDYIGQPSRGSAYDGVGTGHREIERGHSSSRQIQRGGGGGRR